MASVTIISATGRLKNKIDFSYSVTSGFLDLIIGSGMIYTTDPAMLTGITMLEVSSFGGAGRFSTTFTGIPNGTYYVKAYAYDDNSSVNVYSDPMTVFVTDKGYEISSDQINIANPLQIRDAGEGVERVLTSDSSGLATWKSVKSLFAFGHYIGERYGGGIVAAVWKEGEDEKVLIASPEDISSEDGLGVIGGEASIKYKMGNGNYFNNPGSAAPGSCYLTFNNSSGSGPYAGTNNPQDIAVICIHNFDNAGVNQENYLKTLNGTGSTVTNPGGGIGPGTYEYSSVLQKGLFRVKTTTTINTFRVVGYGYHYTFATAPSKFIAASYDILYVGSGTVPGTTMGVFKLYVDYIGSETNIVTTGTGKNFPAAQEVVTIEHDPTGTGLNYLPLSSTSDFKWSAGTAQGTTVGALAQSLYNGDLNSDAIIAQSIALGTTFSAAKVCADYRGSGYDDWYLPSYFELNQVFNNAAIINKVLANDSLGFLNKDYWTSTEYFLPPGGGGANSANAAMAFNSFASLNGSDYYFKNKASTGRVRAVRRESFHTGDGLIMSLDTTNKKSFSDVEYLNIGTSSKWKDLVNGGLTSSYSFSLSSYPTTSSGGTVINILPIFTSTFFTADVYSGLVSGWNLAYISSTLPSSPKLYNRTGESSFRTSYLLINSNAVLTFDAGDFSYAATSTGVKLSIWISEQTSSYTTPYYQIREITMVGASVLSTYYTTLYQYVGKTISIKITAPGAYYNSATDFSGPLLDTIYFQRTSGGYQATGPVYLPEQSGFLRFNGTGSSADDVNFSNTFGSYVNFKAPIGTATILTIEVWARFRKRIGSEMLFGFNIYDVELTGDEKFGFNTGNGDIYGISAAKFNSLGIYDNWVHFVFEMRSDVSYTNNKIYINGNEQVLSYQTVPYNVTAGVEYVPNRNFNGGVGKIGGWALDTRYMFRGDISIFRIYNRALTKDEIMKNYSFEKKRYEILPSLLTNNIFTSIDFDNPVSYSGDGSVTGIVTDLSGNARNADLTIISTTTKPSVIRTNSLYNGEEIVFPGTIAANPYLSWADSVAFQSIQNISVSFWIKFTAHRTSEIIVRWNSTGNTIGPWEVYQQSTTTTTVIAVRLRSSAVTIDSYGSKKIPLDKWTHVCATYDNTTKKIKTYIDSVLDINSAAPNTFSMATGVLGQVCVGRYVAAISPSTLLYPLQGSIASIQIYNKSLSYGEVRNNYDADKFRFDDFSDANKFYSHEINGNPTFSISQNLSLEIGDISNEKILKINSSGYSKWTDKNAIFSRPANYRYIGELYGGGIIVAMWYYPKTIFNYLIMSLEDVSASSQWSNVTAAECNASSDFKGEANQTLIIGQSGHTTSAAKLCDDYAGGGFTDWYLPSVFEMNQAFNAGSIVDTVLGSDLLVGSYWTSTESSDSSWSSTKAFYYSFSEASVASVGSQKTDLKSSNKKVRAFRLATNAVEPHVWDPTWDEEYTPWWRRSWYEPTYWDEPTYWEMDWQPATYNEWDFDYWRDWRRTSVTIGSRKASIGVSANPLITFNSGGLGYFNGTTWNYTLIGIRGSFAATFSNTVYTNENIINNGVCWATNSVTPTISDGVAYSTGPSDFTVRTPTLFTNGPVGSTSYMLSYYFRAFVTTSSGTYYSSDFGSYYSGKYNMATYSVYISGGMDTYGTFPTGCFTFQNYNKSLYE